MKRTKLSGTDALVFGNASKCKSDVLQELLGLPDGQFVFDGGVGVLLGKVLEVMDLSFGGLRDPRQVVDQGFELFCLATDIECQFLCRV